jgi:sec-independent protein translocase protein TatC
MNLHVARALRTRSDDGQEPVVSLLYHLDQLRRRILYACLAVAVGMLIAFAYIKPIFEFVFEPIHSVLPAGSKMIYTQPGEAFSIWVQIALIAGIVFASPFVMYQIWCLIAPALYQRHHKRFAAAFIVLTSSGFLAGALFNHYVVFRAMIAFFASFNSGSLAFMPRLDDVFGLYTKMLFGMGLVFQMPAIVFFLARMGLVAARFLLKQFKYAFLLIFIIAAIVTPSPDAATQVLFAAPMVALYLIGIVIAWIVAPVARRGGDTDDSDNDKW